MAKRISAAVPGSHRTGLGVLAITALLMMISGCTTPPTHDAPPAPAPRPPLPSFHVEFAPTKGQSQAQQDRDRYECFVWATRKTGFDPSRPRHAPVTTYDHEQMTARILNFRRAMTACFIGRNYRVD